MKTFMFVVLLLLIPIVILLTGIPFWIAYVIDAILSYFFVKSELNEME